MYHDHTQEHPPFTLGCIGPNADNSLVSVAQCRAVNADKCSDTADIQLFTVKDTSGTSKIVPYQPDCPCWDASGKGLNGAGLNVGTVATTRKWYTRTHVGENWSDGETGKTFAEHTDVALQGGFAIVELAAVAAGAAAPAGSSNGEDQCTGDCAKARLNAGSTAAVGAASVVVAVAVAVAGLQGAL